MSTVLKISKKFEFMGLKTALSGLIQNNNIYSIFTRVVNEDQLRLENLHTQVFKKVMEVDTNKETVFNSCVKKETPKTFYLKSCIAE
jgi:hypothetical protein